MVFYIFFLRLMFFISGKRSGSRLISDTFSVISERVVAISAKLSLWVEKSSMVAMGTDNLEMLRL